MNSILYLIWQHFLFFFFIIFALLLSWGIAKGGGGGRRCTPPPQKNMLIVKQWTKENLCSPVNKQAPLPVPPLEKF